MYIGHLDIQQARLALSRCLPLMSCPSIVYYRVVVRVFEGRMIDFDVHASISAYHQVSGSQGGIVLPDQEEDI